MSQRPPKVSIAIAVDDEDDALLLVDALSESELEHDLFLAGSGQELMDYLNRLGQYRDFQGPCPDLVLLGLNSPPRGSKIILEKIKQNLLLRDIAVVVLIDSNDWDDLRECYRLGAATVFHKDRSLHEFAEIIRAAGEYWFRFVTTAFGDSHIKAKKIPCVPYEEADKLRSGSRERNHGIETQNHCVQYHG